MYLSSSPFHRKKVLIFDVDGTVCESCQPLDPKMVKRLNQLGKSYTLAFISGSSVHHLQKQISSQLFAPHHLLGTSGCEYIRAEQRLKSSLPLFEAIYNETLSQKEKAEIITTVKELIVTFNIKSKTTPEDQLQDRGSQITLSAIGRNANKNLKNKFDPEGKKRNIWRRWLNIKLPVGRYDVRVGGTTSIDITRKGMNKAYGIRRFAEINKFNFSDMIFYGDRLEPGGNDHSVLTLLDCVPVKNPTDTLLHLKHFKTGNI